MNVKKATSRYISFLIRQWQEREDNTETEAVVTWRCEIESIQTGQKWHFAAPEAMFDFIRAKIVEEPVTDSRGEGRK